MIISSSIPVQIEDLLRDIETRRNVDILLAVEMGSRAWGLDGPASDHDIRIVYRDPPEQAFALFQGKDSLLRKSVIETKDGPVEIELSGWSLSKTLKLAYGSNSQVGEMIHADVVYREDPVFMQDLRNLSTCASPKIMAYHYRGIAKKNLCKKIQQAEQPDIKAHLQMIRGVLAARWFVQNPEPGGFPPLNFNTLYTSLYSAALDRKFSNLAREIFKIVQIKRFAERMTDREFPAVMQWAEWELDQLDLKIRDMPDLTLDREIFESAFRNQYPGVFQEISGVFQKIPGELQENSGELQENSALHNPDIL